MVTRRIFKSRTLTFACDTCKLTRVCEVIVELYRMLPIRYLILEKQAIYNVTRVAVYYF